MDPENILILVDDKPVSSRNSVCYGWRDECGNRGDINWMPVDQAERIRAIRGPVVVRYGNGTTGGTVNTIIRQTDAKIHGNLSVYNNFLQYKAESASERISFGLNGPSTESPSYRVYGSIARTSSDDWNINAGHEPDRVGKQADTPPASREGARSKDIDGLFS